jgi:hypothetical protein
MKTKVASIMYHAVHQKKALCACVCCVDTPLYQTGKYLLLMKNRIINSGFISNMLCITCVFSESVTLCFRLYVPPNSVPRNIANNLLTWLWQDVDTNDNEFQLMRRKLIQDLEETEQGTTYLQSFTFFLTSSYPEVHACSVVKPACFRNSA